MPYEVKDSGDPRDDIVVHGDNSQAMYEELGRRQLIDLPDKYRDLRTGAPVNPADFPLTARLNKQRKMRLPHWFYLGTKPVVSPEMRAAIEAVEPGVHQFIEIKVRNKDQTPWPKPVYYLNVCRSVACLDEHAPNMTRETGEYASYVRRIDFYKPFALRREPIARLHLWRPADAFNSHLFCSDEMQASMSRLHSFKLEYRPAIITA